MHNQLSKLIAWYSLLQCCRGLCYVVKAIANSGMNDQKWDECVCVCVQPKMVETR